MYGRLSIEQRGKTIRQKELGGVRTADGSRSSGALKIMGTIIPGLKKLAAKLPKKQKKTSKGCNCFTAGTKVLTDEGEKNIEDIKVGDKVLPKDETQAR